jgi:hypothetical protein
VIWASCRLLGVKPPGVRDKWEDCDAITQAKLIAFYQTFEHEEMEKLKLTSVSRLK